MRYLMSLLVVAVVSAPALAQEPGVFGPRVGDWEFTVSGTGASDRDFDANRVATNFELSHYLTREMSLGVRQDLAWEGGSNVSDVWDAATRATVAYHFDMGEWRPFIGANLGYKYGERLRDTWTAGPEGGLKWYVQEETFIFGRIGYDFEFRRASDIDEGFRKRGSWVYALGVGFNF